MNSLNIINPRVRKVKLATLFRFIEFFFFLIILSRFSVQLPFAVKISGDYFRRLISPLLGPRFVFFVGNAIVITLYLKSRWVSIQDSNGNKSSVDFCEEFVEKRASECEIKQNTVVEKKISRSQSENFDRDGGAVEPRRQLRRSVTERFVKNTPAEEMSGEEFRRTVEDFIARQQRFLREEEFSAIVGY